jgi:sulfur carrier protein ThiS adenylyltransferase
MSAEPADRFSRQAALVCRERLNDCHVTVVGVGAVGRQVALQLAAMGATRLDLVDFDIVEEANLAPQGYFEADQGRLKVEATADLCRALSSQLDVRAIPGRFQRSMALGEVVFVAVDSIRIRRLIWQACRDRVSFLADGRVAAEVIRVVTVGDAAGRDYYPGTLFTPAEAYAGACTAKMTIYCANLAAGLMLAQFARWLRGLPTEPDSVLNLLAGEWSMASSPGATR